MKQNLDLKKLTLAALFAAMTAAATLLIQIPTPSKGYLNLGDSIVNIAAWMLGPYYGGAAAGLGSAIADLISGYALYAPATLVITAGMAVVSWFAFTSVSKRFPSLPSRIFAAAAAELVMVVGYALFEVIIYQNVYTGVIGIPANILQGTVGAAVSVVIYEFILKKIPKLND